MITSCWLIELPTNSAPAHRVVRTRLILCQLWHLVVSKPSPCLTSIWAQLLYHSGQFRYFVRLNRSYSSAPHICEIMSSAIFDVIFIITGFLLTDPRPKHITLFYERGQQWYLPHNSFMSDFDDSTVKIPHLQSIGAPRQAYRGS